MKPPDLKVDVNVPEREVEINVDSKGKVSKKIVYDKSGEIKGIEEKSDKGKVFKKVVRNNKKRIIGIEQE